MKKLALAAVAGTILMSGCTTMVANDYPAYLSKSAGSVDVQGINSVAHYSITDATMNHQYEVRSFAAGIANAWVVELGKMLDLTLQSQEYSPRFSKQSNQGLDVAFDLSSYEFKNFQTYLTMNVKVTQSGKEIISKAYTTVGKNQTSKVLLGGGFAMKNAVQQSTKLALDDVLKQLLNDLKAQNIAVSQFVPFVPQS